MYYRCTGVSGAGLIRAVNQDNLFVNGQIKPDSKSSERFSCSDLSESGLYAVCDGMGGEQFGEEAALMGVSGLAKITPEEFPARACAYLRAVNADLCRLMRRRGNVRIGTTFVAISIAGDQGRVVNIGDSRCYLYRENSLEQLSHDHTQIQRLISMGFLRKADASKHPDRHKLTQHLGIFPEEMVIEPFVSDFIPIRAGDLFLLCSDGLTDMLTDEDILALLCKDGSVQDKTESLYALAMARGGKDNITVVLIEAMTENTHSLG